MKQIALLSMLLLVFGLGCAGLDKTQTTMQALNGTWNIDTTAVDQEDMAGMYMSFNVKENKAAIGFAPDEEELALLFKLGEQKEPFLVLEIWPVDEPEDMIVFLITVDKDKMSMADSKHPQETFYFIRANQ